MQMCLCTGVSDSVSHRTALGPCDDDKDTPLCLAGFSWGLNDTGHRKRLEWPLPPQASLSGNLQSFPNGWVGEPAVGADTAFRNPQLLFSFHASASIKENVPTGAATVCPPTTGWFRCLVSRAGVGFGPDRRQDRTRIGVTPLFRGVYFHSCLHVVSAFQLWGGLSCPF